MVDEPLVHWMEAANHWTGREGRQPRFIILHGTAGGQNAQDIAAYFALATTQASAHYIIGPGEHDVFQCVREMDAAWSNGGIEGTPGTASPGSQNGIRDAWWTPALNPNLVTIAIEHVKPSLDNSDHLTVSQKQASFTLIKHICERWGIPKRWADAQGGITGHFSIDAINRSHCPGPYPYDELFAFLGGGNDEMLAAITLENVASFFDRIDDQVWKCKQTGYLLGHGMLTFWCGFRVSPQDLGGLTHLGLPTSNEQGVPGKPGVVEQHMERCILRYDPQHLCDNPPGSGPVYLIHLPEDLGGLQKVASL